MGDLARMRASVSMTFTPATYDSAYPLPYAMTPVDVSPDAAMTIATVYACVRAISEDIASVPLNIYQRASDGGKTEASNHPLYELLHDQPNEYQTAMEFREMMTAFAMLRKRAIAEIIQGPRGFVDQIKPLHPDLVTSEVADGKLRYRYEDPLLRRTRILLPDEVFVLRGPFGRSVADFARETFALAMTMRGAAGRTYGRGIRTQGALKHPKTLTDKARQNLREALDRYGAGGENEGRPLLLEEGMDWQSIQMSMKDAEFVAVYGATDAAVIKFFRVPPHKVGDLEHATFSNIEQQSIEYVTDTIRPWAERWEGVIRRDLIIATQTYFAEHVLEGLLRGDIQTRYAAYAVGRQWGWLATNDILRKENMNPIPGGDDDWLVPLNMTTHDGMFQFAPPAKQAALTAQLRIMVRDAAGRAVRKELAAIAKLAERTSGQDPEWSEGVRAFYADHETFLVSLHILDPEQAAAYCDARCQAVLARQDPDETDAIANLTTLALGGSEPLRLTDGAAA